MRELARRPLVVPRDGYDVREATLQAYADAGVTPRFAVQGGEMDAVLRMVEAGTGVAVVPDLVFAGRPGLRRTVLTPPLYRTVALARAGRAAPRPRPCAAFRDTLLDVPGRAVRRRRVRPATVAGVWASSVDPDDHADIHFYFDPVCPSPG